MANVLFQDESQIFNINLYEDAYKHMLCYCTKSNPYETGGVLIGNYSSNHATANILQITPPPRCSTHKKYSFHRSSTGLKEFLDSMWDQGQYYLGEWHYHPNASAVPSHTDLKQMLSLSNNTKLKCPEPILIIIGGNSKDWKISTSIFSDGRCVCLEHVK